MKKRQQRVKQSSSQPMEGTKFNLTPQHESKTTFPKPAPPLNYGEMESPSAENQKR